MCRWCDVIAGSSAPISSIQNLFSQNQHEIASTGKEIIMVGRPEVLSQSLPSFRYRLFVVYQKSLNVSEQNCNVYLSKVWIQFTPKLMCTIYSTAVPLRQGILDSRGFPPEGDLNFCVRGCAAAKGRKLAPSYFVSWTKTEGKTRVKFPCLTSRQTRKSYKEGKRNLLYHKYSWFTVYETVDWDKG